jgi:hypothetical protein
LKEIFNWVKSISEPKKELGGHSICPFAKIASRFKIVQPQEEIIPPEDREFDVIVYTLPDSVTLEDINSLCDNLYKKYPDLIFLPDHKDRDTYINGVKTNNGQHNLILCQPKQKLKDARSGLKKTDYYTYWDKDYLKEILGEDYDMD